MGELVSYLGPFDRRTNIFSPVIELHATFLELNLLSQIRALPNPSFSGTPSTQSRRVHILTLHLSPTSTANIVVISVLPPLSPSVPFAKLAPDAEVIVAPKIRSRSSHNSRTESPGVTSVGQRSLGGKSVRGMNQQKSLQKEPRDATFLRGLDRAICADWFDDTRGIIGLDDLRVWVDRDVRVSKSLREAEWVSVSIVATAGIQAPIDPHQQQKIKDQESSDAEKSALAIVARIDVWDDAPDAHHIVLSSSLCVGLAVENMVGGMVRIEAAQKQLPKNAVKGLKVYPFSKLDSHQSESLRFGGETKANRESTADEFRAIFGSGDNASSGLLNGPLTDGLILGKTAVTNVSNWNGGLIRFDLSVPTGDSDVSDIRWIIGRAGAMTIDVQQEIVNPFSLRKSTVIDAESLPPNAPIIMGNDHLVSVTLSHLSHLSSVLLNGGVGSGKTTVAYLLGHLVRMKKLFHVSCLSCSKFSSEESRILTIKETLNRTFMRASWGARMGGNSLVILDDLDKLCPAETELHVGGENGRSHQLSELVGSIANQYCGADSGVVLLATARGKDSINSILIGSHVVREIVDIKAPDKDSRRQILESISAQRPMPDPTTSQQYTNPSVGASGDWMDGSSSNSRPNSSNGVKGFAFDWKLDFLDIAAQTDGYMPGDLQLLVSRARSEALIRSVKDAPSSPALLTIQLCNEDFAKALRGFKPASLRNVTLQSSSTKFDSIGGLHTTRKILLETLQYPNTYAPIFAQCPLRLRSGLLLYGYPGCGKTLLASAVAGECGLNFISVKGPEILNKYIGASEKSVRDLFERAEAARPCVLFFDEFDSIAPKRGHDSTGVTDRVVNQLLTLMDGAEGLSGVYILAATSRPDLIDPALLRPGRLDKSLLCDLPNLDDRLDILRALSKKLKINPDILRVSAHGRNVAEIARITDGYSGADLQAVIYNAHLEAIQDVVGDYAKRSGTQADGLSDRAQNLSSSESITSKSFIRFRYGETEDRLDAATRDSSGTNRSRQTAENAALLAKMDFAKRAKRMERAQRRGGIFAGSDREEASHKIGGLSGRNGHEESTEVVIQWKHIEASVRTTRASVGLDERRKLESIYREFVVGRNGEMPSGQGGMEIGGRSSLM